MLIPLGALGLTQIGVVMLPILVLLCILYISYRQTIRAYPTNGGAHTVSKENLGTKASLLAAAALTIDYILNVAVGISAGVGALTSALPSLHPYTLSTLDAGRAWALPTYLFVASFILILAIGVFKAMTSGGQPDPVLSPATLPSAEEAVTIWLLMRSFAAGCTAMTGVEAVSNGVSALREPVVRTAPTLTSIVSILGVLLAASPTLPMPTRLARWTRRTKDTKAFFRN